MKRVWIYVSIVVLAVFAFTYLAASQELDLVPYEDEENGFSFSYPADWEPEATEGFVFFAIGDDGLNVGIVKEEGDGIGKISLSDFAEKEKKYLQENLKGFEELSLTEVNIGGQKALLRVYKYKIKVRKFQSLEYYIQGKNDGFVIVFDGPAIFFEKLKNIAEKSIATFKFIGDEVPSSEKVNEPKIVGRKIEAIVEWKTFMDKERGISVDYPVSWKVVAPYEDVIFEVDSPEGYQFQILNHNLGKMGTVKDYFRSTGRWLKKHLKDYNELEVKKIGNGYERVYEFSQNNIVSKVKELYFVKKNKEGNVWGFTLVFVAPKEKFDNANEYFEKIAKSFSLTPKPVESTTPKSEETLTPTPTPKPTSTPITLPTPKATNTPITLPTPKQENTPITLPTPVSEESPTPKTEVLTPSEDDFVLYKNPKGQFQLMVPKVLTKLEEDDDYVIFGDISKGYIIAAGTDLVDVEEEENVDMNFVMERIKDAGEDLGIEEQIVVEGPKEYKGGAMMLISTPKAPFPGMKETAYYVFLYLKPMGNFALGALVMLPKDEYDMYKAYIDFIIDSLK